MADLVTWNTVKTRLGLSDSEQINVESLISVASAAADRFTNRNLAAATYTLLIDGSGSKKLLLPDWPINSVSAVYVNSDREYTDESEVTDFVIYPYGMLWRDVVWPEAPQAVKIECNLGFSIVPADLENAVIELVAYYRARQLDNAIGIRSITSPDGINTAFELSMPMAARTILQSYNKVNL
jgi:hypothetical protein